MAVQTFYQVLDGVGNVSSLNMSQVGLQVQPQSTSAKVYAAANPTTEIYGIYRWNGSSYVSNFSVRNNGDTYLGGNIYTYQPYSSTYALGMAFPNEGNCFIGYGAGNLTLDTIAGIRNTMIGIGTGIALTTGNRNVGIGYVNLTVLTTGQYNVAIGQTVLNSLTTGSSNIGIAEYALRLNVVGIENIAIGYHAGENTLSNGNIFIGSNAGITNTTGEYNMAVGGYSLQLNTTGAYNMAFGYKALQHNITGNHNTAFGYTALNTNTTLHNNTAFGYAALFSLASGSSDNTAVGYNALYATNSGTANSAFGNNCMVNNTTGSYNTAFGDQALVTNTIGNQNTAVGLFSLQYNHTGSYNVAIGLSSLGFCDYFSNNSSKNIGIGTNAGLYLRDGVTQNNDPNNAVYIGHGVVAFADHGTNEIVIGYMGIGHGSNTVTLGNSSTTKNFLFGGVNLAGLPTTRPSVVGDLYQDTAANILAYNDKIVGIRQ